MHTSVRDVKICRNVYIVTAAEECKGMHLSGVAGYAQMYKDCRRWKRLHRCTAPVPDKE